MPAYKDTVRNTWFVKLGYKDKSGKWRYTTKRGFRSKKEALYYETQFKLSLNRDIKMSFEEFVKIYREEHYPRIRLSTAVTTDAIIEGHLITSFGKISMSDITPADILRWQNEIVDHKDLKTGKGYKPSYIRKLNNTLSSIFNFAVRYYGLKENPVHKTESVGRSHSEEMQFWTPGEYMKFSSALKQIDIIAYYCFEVLYWTGMRCGEFLALTKEDVDLDNKTININKTYNKVKGQEVIGPTKTAKGTRLVSLPDELSEEIKEYFAKYKLLTERAFPFTKYYLRKSMEKACKISEVKVIRLHDLRHSHITMLLAMGYTPIEVAKRVGHESITITYSYAHVLPSVERKMVNSINELMTTSAIDNDSYLGRAGA